MIKTLESKIERLNTEITEILNNPNCTARDEARSYRLLLEMMNTQEKIKALEEQYQITLKEVTL